MNIKKRLRHLAEYTGRERQFGRTTLLARLVKETNGVLLTHNTDFATQLQRKFGITAKSMEVNLEGLTGPFFFDHFALETMLLKAANKIEELERQIEELKKGEVSVRQKIELKDSVRDIAVKMAEGNPGALTVIMKMLERDAEGVFQLLSLDDMNIRGTQIWVGFKDYCEGDLDKFLKCVKERDQGMVTKINVVGAEGNHKEVAVTSGASFRRR